MTIYYLAKYLSQLFLDEDDPISHVVKFSRDDMRAQTEYKLIFNSKFTKIDLSKPESAKTELSNMEYLSKLLIFID